MRRFRFAAAVLANAALLLTAGCGPNADRSPSPTPTGASGESAAGPHTRIVSLAPSITETLFALGLAEEIVGVTRYCTYPAEARAKPKVGGYYDPSFEAIMALQPDVVFLIAQHEEAIRTLRHLKVATATIDDSSVQGVLDGIRTIGRVCGRTSQADELARGLEVRIETVRARTAGKPRPRVLVSIGRAMGSGGLSSVYVAGHDGFFNVLLEIAGATTVYPGEKLKFPMVSLEGILELNPDVILDLVANLDQSKYSVADIMAEWQAAAEVTAVQTGRVHVLVEDYVTIPGPRFVLLLEQMARILHPEVEWEQ